MLKRFIACLIYIFMSLQVTAEESNVINDWLITFDDTACWATALITEDPINDVYNRTKDFQFTVSFHNGVSWPQFTIISVTPGKTVTNASVKFNEIQFNFVVIEDTAFSLPKEDRDIIFNMLNDKTPEILLEINNKEIFPTPSVSLKGFKEAYNYLSKICYFRKYPKAMGVVS